MKSSTIAITPAVQGVGGMVSFRGKLTASLEQRGVRVTANPDAPEVDSILVIGGTRRIGALSRARRRGVRIVQRLDGMNWLHRKRNTGLPHFLRAEIGNLLLRVIRNRFADHVIYQSAFSQHWWEQAHGPTRPPKSVIHNGVDLTIFTPEGPENRPAQSFRVLLVEGSLLGGYEIGMESACALARLLRQNHQLPVKLTVAGRVSPAVQARYTQVDPELEWLGLVPHEHIPQLDRSAHVLFSADIHPACPNAVIEALACGLPVVAFDTGALRELVDDTCGRIVPYGGDPWNLDPPDIHTLAAATADVLRANERLRTGARHRAETAFDLETMSGRYLDVLFHKSSE